jgi:hypothetical protein
MFFDFSSFHFFERLVSKKCVFFRNFGVADANRLYGHIKASKINTGDYVIKHQYVSVDDQLNASRIKGKFWRSQKIFRTYAVE